MAKFTDTKGRAWALEITVATVRRVKTDLQVDLLGLVEDRFRPLAALLEDLPKLVDLLYYLCREQAAGVGVDDLGFADGLGGDVLEAAADAFVDALLDFFPNRQRRATLRAALGKGKEWASRQLDKELRRVEAIDPDSLTPPPPTGGAPSGSSPAPSACTPTPSP